MSIEENANIGNSSKSSRLLIYSFSCCSLLFTFSLYFYVKPIFLPDSLFEISQKTKKEINHLSKSKVITNKLKTKLIWYIEKGTIDTYERFYSAFWLLVAFLNIELYHLLAYLLRKKGESQKSVVCVIFFSAAILGSLCFAW